MAVDTWPTYMNTTTNQPPGEFFLLGLEDEKQNGDAEQKQFYELHTILTKRSETFERERSG